jgi:phosphate acetyltransferase
LVREAKAGALMKGSLHTDKLMAAVVAHEGGIRTEPRISHCFIMDVPNRQSPLIITDAAVNIAPSLEEKADIVRNAIDVARALGLDRPLVAILSAAEIVTPKVPSTVEDAAPCKMADRNQIAGGVLDGPLALDTAISPEAASIKNIVSPVGGHASVLVVPNLEAGNMLAKSLSFRGGCGKRGHRDGRARANHLDPSRGQRVDAPCFVCGRSAGRQVAAPRNREAGDIRGAEA